MISCAKAAKDGFGMRSGIDSPGKMMTEEVSRGYRSAHLLEETRDGIVGVSPSQDRNALRVLRRE